MTSSRWAMACVAEVLGGRRVRLLACLEARRRRITGGAAPDLGRSAIQTSEIHFYSRSVIAIDVW